MLQQINVTEFKKNLTQYSNSATPIVVVKQGQVLGYFMPVKAQSLEFQKTVFHEATRRLETLLVAKDIGEDELLQEFRQLREGRA